MNAGRKRLASAIVIILLCSAVCYPQDIASDFQQALNITPEEPKWPSGIMYCDMEEAADSVVSKHSGTSAVEFLETKIEEANSRKLVLLSLAKLAPANEAAENALYKQIYAENYGAIVPVAYLAPDDGRRIAETILKQAG